MMAQGMDTESLHIFKMRDGKIAAFTAVDDTDALRSSMVQYRQGDAGAARIASIVYQQPPEKILALRASEDVLIPACV